MKQLISVFLFIFVTQTFAQNHHFRFEHFDVQHYAFEIHLNDSTNQIKGIANVSVRFIKPAENITLDLVEVNPENKGMTVLSVKQDEIDAPFLHDNNQLGIHLTNPAEEGDVANFQITYFGIPSDGLVISENQYGDRTFFGDNWPDRAKHWLPTIDHPSDKATLEFRIFAPEHYEVVSNGRLVEKTRLENNLEFTYWKEDVALPTKLMVIGVADFEVESFENKNKVEVSNWVFPENKEQGFYNYRFHSKALDYFTDLLGPYTYEKLAHVQSKTRYGGMENAGCIFYHERTGTSKQSQERLFAHEVAHQWFGNSVSEENWHHVWLSEGFATYLTHVYNRHFYGDDKFREGLKNDRERIIRYAKQNFAPIIDTTITEYTKLLNTNSYQKASWVLHMLRTELGNEIFFKGLRKYYADFQNSTALTEDFQHVMEEVSGKDLDVFFRQWLCQPGHPVLDWSWKQMSGNLYISIKQVQKESSFNFPLKIQIIYENGTSEFMDYNSIGTTMNINAEINGKVKNVILDPEVGLLFEVN